MKRRPKADPDAPNCAVLGCSSWLARKQNVTVDLRVADCDDWDWRPATYDVVAAIFVQFAGPEMRRRMFAGMIDTLKPGGYLIL
jgi:hypothetical protein